ncbi:MAG: Crp/Fnr family transcriptional regulator [Deltaproteobacteria bacterium]|nr:Crp/Fnr family transcriptional regulator [Deltaproteobacteria bacterium]
MNHIDAKVLQQLRNLSSFSSLQLEKVAANLAVKNLKRNQVIFDQDEEARLVYLLISGVARVSYVSSDQKQIIVSLIPAGEFFGLDSFVPKMRRPFRCDAFQNSTIGAIRPDILIEILMGIPFESFLHWYQAVMYPMRRMYIHCIKGIGLDLRRRLALELINLADRFGIADARGVSIVLHVSHEVLAGLVGASRQQVTEHLNEFDRKKIISREGRRITIDLNKLRKIVEPSF